jgi:hypothetical protein
MLPPNTAGTLRAPRGPLVGLTTQLDSVVPLVNVDGAVRAVRRLGELKPQALNRVGAELYSTESAAVRRGCGAPAVDRPKCLLLAYKLNSVLPSAMAGPELQPEIVAGRLGSPSRSCGFVSQLSRDPLQVLEPTSCAAIVLRRLRPARRL